MSPLHKTLSRHKIFPVLTVALVARLLVLWFAVAQHGAAWLYTRGLEVGFVADSLLRGQGFSSPFGVETGPTALIAPGYPLLVAGIFKLLGTYSTASAFAIMLAQIAANLLTIALMMKLANALAGPRAALVAGLFWACWLPFLWMPTIFWETSLSAGLLLGLLVFVQRVDSSPTRGGWLCLGLLFGVASLINMALLLSFAGIFCWLAWRHFSRHTADILLAVSVAVVTFSPWVIRNTREFHAFVPLRTTVGLELWMGNHDGASGYLEEALFPIYNRSELQEYRRIGELRYDHEKSAIAREWITQHPTAFLKLSLFRFLRFWSGTGSRGGSIVFAIGALATTIGGICGLFALYRHGNRAIALLYCIPLMLFPLPYYITHAEFRYRLVLDPILTALTAYAIYPKEQTAVAASVSQL